MKFFKLKIKRCKNCKYYRKLGGNIHYCVYSSYKGHPMDLLPGDTLELIAPIPLICFKKENRNGKKKEV